MLRRLHFTLPIIIWSPRQKRSGTAIHESGALQNHGGLYFHRSFFEELPGDFEVELTDAAKRIWHDQDVILEVAKLKQSFETEQEALLHGDLHTGSIFASETETKVIDPEFAFYGPVGFDLGQYTANLLFQAVTRNGAGKEEIFTQLDEFWRSFEKTYSELWNTHNKSPFRHVTGYLPYLLTKFKRDAFGFAGCELIRRTIGLSHVADLNVMEDKETKIAAKTATLKLGALLIKNGKNWMFQRSSNG